MAAIQTNPTRQHAFGLPVGSVRAVLALMLFGGIWVWLATRPTEQVPHFLENLMFIIMGHYFAARAAREPGAGPAPLYLPKGTVRTILIGGFAIVAGYLFYRSQILTSSRPVTLTNAGVTLILVTGFLLGVLRSRLFHRTTRWLEDLRASVALCAGIALLLIVFNVFHVPDQSWLQHLLVRFRTEDVLAALVGFYFGSKS